MDIIDHRLIGAVRVDLFDRGRAADIDDAAAVFQTSTIEALLDGVYEGDLTVGELLAHGDLGVGTVDHLDGEMIVVDGAAFVARSDGSVIPVPDDVGTPFAAVCWFRPGPAVSLGPFRNLSGLTAEIDVVAPDAVVLAVRVDGFFDRLVVRSVARQDPPYPPLRDVVAHQSEWTLTSRHGSLVGFRFPDTTSGLEVPGWHLHFIDDARSAGGHVIDVAASGGSMRFEVTKDLHVEVPASNLRPDRRAGSPEPPLPAKSIEEAVSRGVVSAASNSRSERAQRVNDEIDAVEGRTHELPG